MHPRWFGLHYPTMDDLLSFADSKGAAVEWAAIPFGVYLPNVEGMSVILIPKGLPPMAEVWALSHELGHLVRHSGPKGEYCHRQEERQANHWAACAMIPESRILLHQNACQDSMIAALSAHFEDIPMRDCPTRRLAGKIAKFRLEALLREVA